VKIPATVVTGFLGAGKTTLIRHLLDNAGGARLALVINEFGDLGIDRQILLGCGDAGCAEDDVIELANGCLCCTVADAFLPTMERLIDRPRPPDHILIETSGLALPKPLVKAFQWPDIRSKVTVDGVVAVIDAPAVAAGRFADDIAAVQAERRADPAADHDAPLKELFEDQLACADLVVLNKTDAIAETTLGDVRATIAARVRPATKTVATRFGALDPRVALGLGAAAEDDVHARPSHHDADGDHDHDDFTSFVAGPGPVADPDDFVARLERVITAHDVLRIKGFLDIPGRPMRCVVQAVGPRIERYFDRPWSDGDRRASRLVVIARQGIDRPAIEVALGAVAAAAVDG
jgi:cobalamin biosynthesis protein CobW